MVGEWDDNHDGLHLAMGWWPTPTNLASYLPSARDYLFADGHVKYLRAAVLIEAQAAGPQYSDNCPDPNVTPGGLSGNDVP